MIRLGRNAYPATDHAQVEDVELSPEELLVVSRIEVTVQDLSDLSKSSYKATDLGVSRLKRLVELVEQEGVLIRPQVARIFAVSAVRANFGVSPISDCKIGHRRRCCPKKGANLQQGTQKGKEAFGVLCRHVMVSKIIYGICMQAACVTLHCTWVFGRRHVCVELHLRLPQLMLKCLTYVGYSFRRRGDKIPACKMDLDSAFCWDRSDVQIAGARA